MNQSLNKDLIVKSESKITAHNVRLQDSSHSHININESWRYCCIVLKFYNETRTSAGRCLAIVSTTIADDPVDGDGNDVGDAGEVDDDDD